MNDLMNKLELLGIVLVAVLDDAKDAKPLANAVKAGGIPCLEITLRTAAALDSIREASEVEGVLVGAGSVVTVDQCQAAVEAGAKFIVSPGFVPKVVAYCLERNIPVLPGCVTPTEIAQAIEMGLDTVKFFPANVYGGLSAMKALAGPFPNIRFIPTGGINAANLGEYIAAPFIRAVGGSWICAKADVAAGNFEKITALCKEARKAMLGYELAHIGINTADKAGCDEVCDGFVKAFDLPVKVGNSSNFVTPAIEVMNSPYLGTNGHIAIRTNSLARAVADLESRGLVVDQNTAKFKNGKCVAVYLRDEVGGFALHLLQK